MDEEYIIKREDTQGSVSPSALDDRICHTPEQGLRDCQDSLNEADWSSFYLKNNLESVMELKDHEALLENSNMVTNTKDLTSNLKNKIVELDETQDLQIDQNSENQQLEDIQNMTKVDKTLDKMFYSNNYIDDLEKTQDGKTFLSNSIIENFLIEFEIKRKNDENNVCNFNESLKSPPVIDSEVSDHDENVTRNMIYQLPPVRRIQSTKSVENNTIRSKPKADTPTSLAVRHLYQNLPVPLTNRQAQRHASGMHGISNSNNSSVGVKSPSQTPTYVNIPLPRTLKQNHLKHSYIQLWSGGQHDSPKGRESGNLFDFDSQSNIKSVRKCKSRISSPGYVQMTSPYVRSPVASVYGQLARSLANYAGQAPQTIFCPLCPQQFQNESYLANHIQHIHRTELESMIDCRPGDIPLHCCPICQAKFYNSAVLPKHLIDAHKNCLIQLLETHDCIEINSKGMQCPFCPKCVPAGINGEHIMIFHLQQYHQMLFDEIIHKTFRIRKNSPSKIIKHKTGYNFESSETPELSGKMGTLIVNSDSKRKLDDMEKEETWPPDQHRYKNITGSSIEKKIGMTPKCYQKPEPRRSISKGILRRDKTPRDRPNVKRELRFSVPHVTREKLYFPESPGPVTPDNQERLDLETFTFPGNNVHITENSTAIDADVPAADDLTDTNHQTSNKRRRIGIGAKTKNIFKCKDKENSIEKYEISEPHVIYATSNTRSFRKPKPVVPPQVPVVSKPTNNGSPCASKLYSTSLVNNITVKSNPNNKIVSAKNNKPTPTDELVDNAQSDELCPFSSLKLYSPLRLFRCNSCRNKFCDNDSLLGHISQQHRGLLSLLRPQFGCGVCSAKFYENKQLVKHCLQHHTSLLEIRGPSLSASQDLHHNELVTSPILRKSNHLKNSKQVTAL